MRISKLHYLYINPFSDKILARSKFRASANDNFDVAKIIQFIFDRVENIVGKGENAGDQHFLLFPQCFQKVALQWKLKAGLMR